jgi:hypothetical protein
MHPTSDPQQTPVHQSTVTPAPFGNQPKQASLLDYDDHEAATINTKTSSLNMNHEPMVPSGKPLERSDTETSETDVFVDAES